MAQIFPASANILAKASILGGGLGAAAMVCAVAVYALSGYVTRVRVPILQPVLFSHEHHVNSLGLDCRYCHTSVEESSFAGIPPTHTCMTCHSQIWLESAMLAPVRESYATNTPMLWARVHNLADFTYFNHAIHVQQGFGCETCHGRVDLMPLVWKEKALFMSFCLECHRAPERFIRPRAEVFTMGYQPPEAQHVLGPRLITEYNISLDRLTDCTTCHR